MRFYARDKKISSLKFHSCSSDTGAKVQSLWRKCLLNRCCFRGLLNHTLDTIPCVLKQPDCLSRQMTDESWTVYSSTYVGVPKRVSHYSQISPTQAVEECYSAATINGVWHTFPVLYVLSDVGSVGISGSLHGQAEPVKRKVGRENYVIAIPVSHEKRENESNVLTVTDVS